MSSIKVEEHFIQIVGFCQNIKIYDHCMKLIRPFLIPCVLRLSKNVVAWNATLYAWLLLQWELAWHFWNLILATWIGNALGHLACYKCQGMKCQFCKTLCECWSKCSTSFCINVLGLSFVFVFLDGKYFDFEIIICMNVHQTVNYTCIFFSLPKISAALVIFSPF